MTVVFPIGQLLGAFHPGPGEESAYQRIRLGDATLPLYGTVEFQVWALAHGVGSGGPTDLDSFKKIVTDRFGVEADVIADELIQAGALAVVTDDVPARMDFANAHCLRPLLSAAAPTTPGAAPADQRFAIAGMGMVVATVDIVLLDLWWLCGAAPTLWSACQRVASTNGGAPLEILDHFFASENPLITRNVAYLDLPRDPAAFPRPTAASCAEATREA
jgi:hypothetical protein